MKVAFHEKINPVIIPTILFVLTILIAVNTCFAQTESLARLPVRGYVTELGVSPTGEIRMASKAGYDYFTKKFGDLWHFGSFGGADPTSFSFGNGFERINFLSEDILIISGFIQKNGKQNFVYRSEDRGKTWEEVIFGKSSWIDAAHFTMNGKGWMSGSSQLIYYTEDYGKTWETKDKVGNSSILRFSTIHFDKHQQVGLFGAFWNKIYQTTDNCESWEEIETPLNQGKYERISAEDRPDIRKIRILGEYYLVNQQGKVFYSDSENIDWQLLPGIVDFEVSETKGYLITKQLQVQLIDEDLTSSRTLTNFLPGLPEALKAIDTTLYAYTGDEIIRATPSSFERSQLLTDDIPIPEPYTQIKFKREKYGFEGTDILKYTNKGWIRVLRSPFRIHNAAVFQDRLIISDYTLSQRSEFDPVSGELLNYKLPDNIFDPGQKLKRFTIGVGSVGCFHLDDHKSTYQPEGNILRLSRSKNKVKGMPEQIDMAKVQEIISFANRSRIGILTIEDLKLTSSDIADYKSLISKKEQQIKTKGYDRFDYENPFHFPTEKTDFDFYRAIADSLNMIDNSVISDIFAESPLFYSTTRIWHQLIFEFANGSKLIISNSDMTPNYLYTPWVISYNGMEYKTNSLALGRLINEVTNGNFYEKYANDPRYAIFKIADHLYRRKLENE